MNCTGSSGEPGASTSPPRATRCGQYVKRPVGSCGPTMRPGRTTSAASPNASSTIRSQAAFRAPYNSGSSSVSCSRLQLRHRGAFHRRHALVRVDRDAGDEHVAADVALQHLDGAPGLVRHVRRDVEHRVPLAPLERREVGGAVAAQLLHLREELRLGLTAVEERRLVPLLERRVDERASEKPRTAEDENSHPG